MNDIIRAQDIDGLDFIDPRKYRLCFTVDNEPIYVPVAVGRFVDESIGEQTTANPNDKRHKTNKSRRKSSDRCIYYTAEDVVEMLDMSMSQAYKVIKALNEELEKKGYIVQAGRVSKVFFHEKYYGMERMLSEQKK